MGEALSRVRKTILLIESQLIKKLFNMKMRETDPTTSHINTFSRMLSELSSQRIHFEEEVKALALLSSLLVSWKVFCTTFANEVESGRNDRPNPHRGH